MTDQVTSAPGSNSSAQNRSDKIRDKGSRPKGTQTIPWDNGSPFTPTERSSCLTGRREYSRRGASRPVSAPALRVLTSNDPVFGKHERETDPHPQRLSCYCSPKHAAHHCSAATRFAEGPDNAMTCGYSSSSPCNRRKESAIQNLQPTFELVTVGDLIELSRLHNPPKPVLAVFSALACLLGLRPLSKGAVARSSRRRHALLFSNAYVLRDLLGSLCPSQIPQHRMSALAKRLDADDAAHSKVRGASTAATPLLDWLLAVVTRARTEHTAVVSAK